MSDDDLAKQILAKIKEMPRLDERVMSNDEIDVVLKQDKEKK